MSAANPNYCQGTNKLFHRAVLASGSSLAHSATVRDPVEVTRQVETWLILLTLYQHCHLNINTLSTGGGGHGVRPAPGPGLAARLSARGGDRVSNTEQPPH